MTKSIQLDTVPTNQMHILENNFLSIKVNSKGAEINSIYNKQTKLEYLWQAGEAWAKHAPILFPIVGKLKNDTYQINGKSYELTQHGFARDLNFELIKQTENELIFGLNSSDQTINKYPFNFNLEIIYRLIENILEVEVKVTNTGNEQMFFSVGFHPAFKVPIEPHLRYDDYYLEFKEKENIDRWSIVGGLIGEPYSKVLQNENHLPLNYSLFNEDALVFKSLKSSKITLKSDKSVNGLAFFFNNFPFFGIWAKKNADFVCLEPWHGIADAVESNQQLKNKEGIRSLARNEEFSCGYQVATF
ncbi:aldose 1-epimerase family protein [Solitalea lacus]|uniref:aldose 1-epimerase family protein n=1 Tax=Solitalea lacus TaxID=2911172 RepID=UPI001EDC5D14|nr:aldose 1-epimerase family protein [Solitalea lacus]UKJ05936.1 aldose 1-epimerase family protein [Solitalea lacus]